MPGCRCRRDEPRAEGTRSLNLLSAFFLFFLPAGRKKMLLNRQQNIFNCTHIEHRRGGFSAAACRNHPFNEPAYGSQTAS